MKVAISGATGFIGVGLVGLLTDEGHEVIALTREPAKADKILGQKVRALQWTKEITTELMERLEGTVAFVNLAGENIGSSIWTRKKRIEIAASRIRSGRLMTEVIRSMKDPPEVLIQASAVGYYGSRGDESVDENSAFGEGFLPEVCIKWEMSTAEVESLGVRRVLARTGVVLSRNGGAFPKLAFPYRLHLGTVLGSGRQWLPWIHYEDEIKAIYHLMQSDSSAGPHNLTSPNPVRMEELCKLLGPTIFKIPPKFVEVILGQMGKETILSSQRVMPGRLLGEDFNFKYRDIRDAIRELVRSTDIIRP